MRDSEALHSEQELCSSSDAVALCAGSRCNSCRHQLRRLREHLNSLLLFTELVPVVLGTSPLKRRNHIFLAIGAICLLEEGNVRDVHLKNNPMKASSIKLIVVKPILQKHGGDFVKDTHEDHFSRKVVRSGCT